MYHCFGGQTATYPGLIGTTANPFVSVHVFTHPIHQLHPIGHNEREE
jgi:hypothetical protein